MTYLDDIIEAIEKGNKESLLSRGNHHYLKAIAISLREMLKIYKTQGVIPNFIILDEQTKLNAVKAELKTYLGRDKHDFFSAHDTLRLIHYHISDEEEFPRSLRSETP